MEAADSSACGQCMAFAATYMYLPTYLIITKVLSRDNFIVSGTLKTSALREREKERNSIHVPSGSLKIPKFPHCFFPSILPFFLPAFSLLK